MINTPIYRTDVMIVTDSQNYIGTIDLFEDRCVVYNDKRILNEFVFEITHTDIETGISEINFLDLYKKDKEYVRLIYNDKKSTCYFFNEYRKDLFIGKFEQRKAECRNHKLVLKAFELGYGIKKEAITKKAEQDLYISALIDRDNITTRYPKDINKWEDLLTPVKWRDYYHSLGATGKKVYDTILEGIIECRKSVEVEFTQLKAEVVGIIYHYILWDNPAIFCIGEYAMWRALEEDGKHIAIKSLCGSPENEISLRHEVLNAVKKILNSPGIYEYSDIQKEKFVHDYIISNWTYDRTCGNGGARLEPYTVYGALVQRSAVCEGFAKTAKLLLDILGVHSQVISGVIKP